MIGIYEIDMNTQRFINVSDVMCDGLGYTKEDLIGQHVTKLMTDEGIAHFAERLQKMRSGEMLDGSKTVYLVKAKDGKLVPCEIEAFYRIDNGKIVGAIVAAREVASASYT